MCAASLPACLSILISRESHATNQPTASTRSTTTFFHAKMARTMVAVALIMASLVMVAMGDYRTWIGRNSNFRSAYNWAGPSFSVCHPKTKHYR